MPAGLFSWRRSGLRLTSIAPAKALFATETSNENNKADNLEHRDLGKPVNPFGASRLFGYACL